MIAIPSPVLKVYSRFRPTRLFRAREFEKALATDCEIFVKDESGTPTRNHKANSAYPIAYFCGKDGFQKLTTETTGNWGIALAIAAKEFGLESMSFLDETSDAKRPGTRDAIEALGSEVVLVRSGESHCDLLKLSANAAIRATRYLKRASYVFGSVFAYFTVPQSIMGIEALQQLESIGKYPDAVIGSCGGGANLLGISAPFLIDVLNGKKEVQVISAESENCPILSRGTFGFHSVDTLNNHPALETYGLDGLLHDEYIGGLGSTIVATAVAHFHRIGLITATVITSEQALAAANVFEATEGIRVALETAYQLAAVVQFSQSTSRKIVLVTVSSGDNDALFYDSTQRQSVL